MRWTHRSPPTWRSCPPPTERSMLMRRGSRNWSSTSPATLRRSLEIAVRSARFRKAGGSVIAPLASSRRPTYLLDVVKKRFTLVARNVLICAPHSHLNSAICFCFVYGDVFDCNSLLRRTRQTRGHGGTSTEPRGDFVEDRLLCAIAAALRRTTHARQDCSHRIDGDPGHLCCDSVC